MSKFDKVIDRKDTYSTQWDYTIDRFQSEDILPFSISDTDFSIPKSTIKVLNERNDHGVFGYTRWKNDNLLNAIKNWYNNNFNLKIESEQICYSPTVIFSMSELVRMKSKKNERIFFFSPAYDGFFTTLRGMGMEIVTSELEIKNHAYTLNKSDFEDKIKNCSVMLLCSPHNPVGKVFSKDEMTYIFDICVKNNIFIISDEIHMDLSFTKQHYPLLHFARNYRHCCIITSATKTFNFPSLQFSYVIFNDLNLKREFESNLKTKYGLSSCTVLGMLATIDVYNNNQKYVQDLKDYVYDNYKYVKEQIENKTKLKIHNFEATYLLWIDASAYSTDIDRLLEIMYTNQLVGIMSGEVYGNKKFLRMNIGTNRKKIIEGTQRIVKSIEILGGINVNKR